MMPLAIALILSQAPLALIGELFALLIQTNAKNVEMHMRMVLHSPAVGFKTMVNPMLDAVGIKAWRRSSRAA